MKKIIAIVAHSVTVFGAMVVVASLAIFFASRFGGAVEGWVFPVVDIAIVDRMQQVGPERTRIEGTLYRKRNCSFTGMEFRVHGVANYAVADVLIEEATKARDQGESRFGPWVVNMRPDQFDRASAVAYHRCHPLWLTETTFYRQE